MLDLVVYFGIQSRKNLQILGAVGILPIIRYLDIPISSLLLRLSYFNPLLSGEMLAKFSEDILCQSKSLQKWTVRDGVQNDMIVWSTSN